MSVIRVDTIYRSICWKMSLYLLDKHKIDINLLVCIFFPKMSTFSFKFYFDVWWKSVSPYFIYCYLPTLVCITSHLCLLCGTLLPVVCSRWGVATSVTPTWRASESRLEWPLVWPDNSQDPDWDATFCFFLSLNSLSGQLNLVLTLPMCRGVILVNYIVDVSNCTNLFLAEVLCQYFGTEPGLRFCWMHTHTQIFLFRSTMFGCCFSDFFVIR